MSQMFDVMETKVSELKTVNDSVLELITRLVAGIQGALTLQEAQKIVAEVDVEKQRLADAVTANTLLVCINPHEIKGVSLIWYSLFCCYGISI
jgi:hypothetical protein